MEPGLLQSSRSPTRHFLYRRTFPSDRPSRSRNEWVSSTRVQPMLPSVKGSAARLSTPSFRTLPTTPGTPSISTRPQRFQKVRKKSVSKQQSLLIAVKNYKLPVRFPQQFSTCEVFKNDKGEEIPLLHRDVVLRTMKELDREIQPVLKEFQVYYSGLSEAHPQWPKAAYTNRIPLNFEAEEKAFAHHIQIRFRNRSAPNDSLQFYNKSTLFALLFHELAHIRHMNHGYEFMYFLRDIYKFAARKGVFKTGEYHQLPSCRLWENRLFEKAGALYDFELREMDLGPS